MQYCKCEYVSFQVDVLSYAVDHWKISVVCLSTITWMYPLVKLEFTS